MKRLNKKGFTLIELLAVIVILAILVTISIPAVTRYLSTARKDTYITNAQNAINEVRKEEILHRKDGGKYTLTDIQSFFDNSKGFTNSPYGKEYTEDSYIQVTYDTNGNATYTICLVDEGGTGIVNKTEAQLDINGTDVITMTGATCTTNP